MDPNITAFPVTLSALMPSDGTAAGFKLTIQGTMCSECANGYSNFYESPYSTCPHLLTTTQPPLSYLAAKPRWFGEAFRYSYVENITTGPVPRAENVPNSCGCTVD